MKTAWQDVTSALGGTRFCLGQFERIGLERSPEYDEVLKG